MIRSIYSLLFALAILSSCQAPATKFTLHSPDGKLQANFELDESGKAHYQLFAGDSLVIESSRLGLQLATVDLADSLVIAMITPAETVTDAYSMLNGKRKECSYEAREKSVRFVAKEDIEMTIDFRLSNEGLAFRYHLSGPDGSEVLINEELTTFDLPDSGRAWLHPHAVAQSGWEHTQPSYEENYEIDIPVGTESTLGQGWSFPALFQANGHWLLLTETNVGRQYCGTHLAHESPDGEYRIAFPQAPERMGPDSPLNPESALPLSSPWRIITVGSSLATIVESTATTDLAEPSKLDDASFIQPGQSSWSWVLKKDDSTVYDVQKRFIDYAADMNWEYCLTDCFWDVQIGYDSIRSLASYAAGKGVGLQLWYNSNGSWNTAPFSPINKVTDPEIRRAEFAKLREWGVKGLKIDFFGGDGQSFMNYYQDLIEDAARYGMTINFHGTTIPRGWERTYPNLMTMESVKGFEFTTFEQVNSDRAPVHCTVLPFTRNAVGPMDFTPMAFSETPNLQRRTSNAFELAQSVLFQSGIQHYAAIPEGMAVQPEYVVNFLRQLPNQWEDIRFIDGFPGKFVIIARRAGEQWYVAGINGTDEAMEIQLDSELIGGQGSGQLITDGETNRSFQVQHLPAMPRTLSLPPRGGFVWQQ